MGRAPHAAPDALNAAADAVAARQAGVGMWADSTPAAQTSPWQFRHTPQPLMTDASGCITGPKGGRYRVLPDGRKQYGC